MEDRIIRIKRFGCRMNKLDIALVTSSLQRAGLAGNLVKAKITKTPPLMLFGDLSS
jgi:tRNA A37 methylthiotransferase MiaB